jgi:hypothetical protein
MRAACVPTSGGSPGWHHENSAHDRFEHDDFVFSLTGRSVTEDAVPHHHADAEVAALSVVMSAVQSVESAPVRASTDLGVPMVDPMVDEGKVVVSGVEPEDE